MSQRFGRHGRGRAEDTPEETAAGGSWVGRKIESLTLKFGGWS